MEQGRKRKKERERESESGGQRETEYVAKMQMFRVCDIMSKEENGYMQFQVSTGHKKKPKMSASSLDPMGDILRSCQDISISFSHQVLFSLGLLLVLGAPYVCPYICHFMFALAV